MVFSSFAAKKRPGLTGSQRIFAVIENSENVPCMSTVSEGQILGRRRDKLMLYTSIVPFTQVRKSKGLECVGVFVERSVMVYRSSGCDDRGTFWYKRAVREREVFQCLASQTRWLVE